MSAEEKEKAKISNCIFSYWLTAEWDTCTFLDFTHTYSEYFLIYRVFKAVFSQSPREPLEQFSCVFGLDSASILRHLKCLLNEHMQICSSLP